MPTMPIADRLFQFTVLALALFVFIGVPILMVRTMRSGDFRIKLAIQRIFDRAEPLIDDEPPVAVKFHVYYGMIVWFRQVPVEFAASPRAARMVLHALLMLNLRNLCTFPGAIFVPLLTLMEYWEQKRHIRRAESNGR